MSKDYKKIARTVISTEIDGLRKLRKSINSSFNKAVELILKAKNAKIIYGKWQSEDGGRFHLKSNFNMIVEVDENEELDIPDSFIWVTLFQIKQLLKIENFKQNFNKLQIYLLIYKYKSI